MAYKKMKRLLIIVFSTSLTALSIMACSGDENTNNTGLNSGLPANGGDLSVATGNGRFIETERVLPDEMKLIMDMVLLDDGTIRIIDQLGSLYDSSDHGVSWELSSVQLNIPYSDENTFLYAAALSSNGSAFLSYEAGHVYINSSGDASMVKIELPMPEWATDMRDVSSVQRLQIVSFTSDNNIIGKGMMANLLYHINPTTGEVISTFGDENSNVIYQDFTEINGKVLAITSEGLDGYDLESGRLLELDQPLREFFTGQELHLMGFGIHHTRLFSGIDENTLYFVSPSGLYRYVLGGSQVEQLINGNLTTMSNPAYGFREVLEIPENSFLISYWGGDDQRLMDYTFDPDADTVPSEEITVFSIFENPMIRQAISTFQSNHSNLLIHYEVGLSDEEAGLTVSDVISSLNTRIMAGTGPDILILDGLPYESYIRNGVLLELSQLVDSLTIENDYFENILEFGRENGSVYYVPAAFNLLAATGPENTLDGVMDLSTLADLFESLRTANPDSDTIAGSQTAEALLRALIHYTYPSLYNYDGTVNTENLTAFLEDVKRIFDVNMTPAAFAEMMAIFDEWGHVGMVFMGALEPQLALDFQSILNNEKHISIGAISNFFAFDMLMSVNELASWDYKVRNEFLPTHLVGINAGSNRLEESKMFFKFLFGESMQTGAFFDGLPVMMDGVKKQFDVAGEARGGISIATSDGEFVSLDIYGASVQQLNRLIQEIEQVSIPSVPNLMIIDVIIREGVSFLNDEQSLEDAVEGILGSVNLFLAE